MFELIRSAEGEITREEFRRGAVLLVLLSFGAGLLLYFINSLSGSMDWMTVAIAPVLGLVVVFAGCSLLYFWFCLFAKRLRQMGQSPQLLYAWLVVIFMTGAAGLLGYQNASLNLAQTGWITYASSFAILFAFLGGVFFVILLGICWLAQKGKVKTGK